MRLAQFQDQLHIQFQTPDRHTVPDAVRLPRWRNSLFGYPASLVLVGLGLGLGVIETQLRSPFSFPGVPLLFAVVLIALLWGVRPASFAILLSLLVLDYLYIPPFGTVASFGWDGLLQLSTFAAASFVVALLARQRETARIRAVVAEHEAVLRARQLEATFNAMNDSVVVYNRKGEVLQNNAATRTLFGIQKLPVELQATKGEELLLQAVQRDAYGQLLPKKQQLLTRIFRGEALTGPKATDTLIRPPDGREVILNMSGAPIRDETGAIENAVLIYRDVTERRRLEQQTSEALQALLAMAQVLVELPERLSNEREASLSKQAGERLVELSASIIKSMHVVMFAVDAVEDSLSPMASIGLTPLEELEWKERLATSPSLINQLGEEKLIKHLQDDEVLVLDGINLPLYTQVFPYYVKSVMVAPILVDKRLVGIICLDDGSREHTYTAHEMMLAQTVARLTALILSRAQLRRDHAETRANELALRETNQRMETYISIICHELRSPLTIMQTSLQLAERKFKKSFTTGDSATVSMQNLAPVQALLDRTRNQIAVQERLINDLLDVSRIQTQGLSFELQACNLVQIVQQAVENQRQAIDNCVIHLETPAEQDVTVYGDADRLNQVVTNYLTNALKYSLPGQPITVRLQVDGCQVARVLVRDEGPGIALVEQERIWERFYQVPGSAIGLGVGLHLCQNIITRHGGEVGVQSSPGDGSTFWFSLPLNQH